MSICAQSTLHWTQRINHVSKFLGPNALPPEELHDGVEDSLIVFRLMGQSHFSNGDNTYNTAATMRIPIFDPRVTLRLHLVLHEFFELDPETVIERNQFDTSTTGTSMGDLNIATIITLLQENAKRPAIRFRMNMRLTTGRNMDQARVIDAPGNSFIVAIGKTSNLKILGTKSFRWYINGGFRVYQSRRPDPAQNDIVAYGVGFDLNWKKLRFTNRLTGYDGHLEQGGDNPVVYRSRLSTLRNSPFNYGLQFSQGNADYPYTSFSLMGTFSF